MKVPGTSFSSHSVFPSESSSRARKLMHFGVDHVKWISFRPHSFVTFCKTGKGIPDPEQFAVQDIMQSVHSFDVQKIPVTSWDQVKRGDHLCVKRGSKMDIKMFGLDTGNGIYSHHMIIEDNQWCIEFAPAEKLKLPKKDDAVKLKLPEKDDEVGAPAEELKLPETDDEVGRPAEGLEDSKHFGFFVKGFIQRTDYTKKYKKSLKNGLLFKVCYTRCLDAESVLQNAYMQYGDTRYNLLFWNCEHFATECKTGVRKSFQVQRLKLTAKEWLVNGFHRGGFSGGIGTAGMISRKEWGYAMSKLIKLEKGAIKDLGGKAGGLIKQFKVCTAAGVSISLAIEFGDTASEILRYRQMYTEGIISRKTFYKYLFKRISAAPPRVIGAAGGFIAGVFVPVPFFSFLTTAAGYGLGWLLGLLAERMAEAGYDKYYGKEKCFYNGCGARKTTLIEGCERCFSCKKHMEMHEVGGDECCSGEKMCFFNGCQARKTEIVQGCEKCFSCQEHVEVHGDECGLE